MDLLLILLAIAAIWFVAWLAFAAGRNSARREAAYEVAGLRTSLRRTYRDLDHARDETAMLRRALRDGSHS